LYQGSTNIWALAPASPARSRIFRSPFSTGDLLFELVCSL
jgi:hypothetical protein